MHNCIEHIRGWEQVQPILQHHHHFGDAHQKPWYGSHNSALVSFLSRFSVNVWNKLFGIAIEIIQN